jgi:hypothetical protein
LLHLSASYVENDTSSYREVASPKGRRRTYQSPPGTPAKDERGLLDHSTIWRMLTWIGCQLPALAEGRQMIRDRNPSSDCHRFQGAVAPHKFRSPQRQQLLCQASQLLHVMAEWEDLFQEKYFPRFATRAGFD